MEGLPMVCYSRGTMNSLLHKLTNMKNHPSIAQEHFELVKEVRGLKRDFLDKIASQGETHMQVTVWMKQVRNLVFDMEDWIDLKPDTNMVDPSDDTEEFKYFKTEIMEARERITRYGLLEEVSTEGDPDVSAPSKIIIDPPLHVEERTCHVVLEGPRDKLVNQLMDKQTRLKVVSVVGIEGLGKTTLAKEIYAKLHLQGHFECQAIVSVGRRPSTRKILNDIFSQVNPPVWRPYENRQRQPSITELRQYLSRKRYFIILDGIWSTQAWKVINCALPANNRGSRLLTTTCIADIGKFCTGHPNDVVYQMAVLSEKNSRILFLSRISPLVKEKLPCLVEDLGNMLNIFGGMPLAITVGACLFARKSEEMAESKMLWEYVISSLKQYPAAERMKRILEISYADLSLPVRSCFMYLSIFPENYTIKKDRLIRLWEAEGFIPKTDKECSWVTGETYINELISRGLIQPVFDDYDDQAVGCTLHSVILEFIIALSRQENFATRSAELSCGPFPSDTIRRFSLDRSNEDEAGTLSKSTMHLSRVRSLTVFGDTEGMFDPPLALDYEEDEEIHFRLIPTVGVTLLSFKLMRVLDLEDTNKLRESQLKGIGGLVLLRYLGLRRTGISDLPKEIGHLEHLETLDLRENGSIMSIHRFPKLVRLLADIDARGIQNLFKNPELEEVSEVHVHGWNSFDEVAELLRKCKRLKMLGVSIYRSDGDAMLSFCEEVVKSNVHSLSIDCSKSREFGVESLLDSLKKATASAAVTFEPRRFELTLFSGTNDDFRQLPSNMASLVSLTHLGIKVSVVGSEELDILGSLPNLVYLKLSSRYLIRGSVIIKTGAFPCLRMLFLDLPYGMKVLEFKGGAAPQLRRLSLNCKPWRSNGRMDLRIEHLTCLTRVQATIEQATGLNVEAVVSHIRDQVSRNPNKPTLELSFYNQDTLW